MKTCNCRGNPAPDLLTGYREAGAGLDHARRDAEHRLLLAPDSRWGRRFGDVEVHTQCRIDYADRYDKARIVRAATSILNRLVDRHKTSAEAARYGEALTTLRHEEERVFVAVFLGNVWHLAYWDWTYAYTIDAQRATPGRRRFEWDLRYRRIATPELAAERYGNALVRSSRMQ